MVGPLGVLSVGPAVATSKAEEVVDGGPLGLLPTGLTTVSYPVLR
jgi:hypothetical protein